MDGFFLCLYVHLSYACPVGKDKDAFTFAIRIQKKKNNKYYKLLKANNVSVTPTQQFTRLTIPIKIVNMDGDISRHWLG